MIEYPEGIALTPHSAQRLDQMGLTAREVIHVWRDPDLSYPGHSGRRVLVGGRLAVVMADDVVVTVLWRAAEGREANGLAVAA